MAITMVLTLVVVFMLFSLAFDAGTWYFDHRSAQNEADALALAAAAQIPKLPKLPDTTTTPAEPAIVDVLLRNGMSCPSPACLQVKTGGAAPTCTGTGQCVTVHFQNTLFVAPTDDHIVDKVTVLVRRPSPIFFSALAEATNVWISASAAALAGPAAMSNVMPWALVAPDPACHSLDSSCTSHDINGNGLTDPGECVNAPFATCPFGLSPSRLFAFKEAGGQNTGMVDLCGSGISNYKACIAGAATTGVYAVDPGGTGSGIGVGLQSGSGGQNTTCELKKRLKLEVANDPDPCKNSLNSTWANSPCNVRASPTNTVGYDPDGAARAVAKFVTAPPQPFCQNRVVLLPIVDQMPASGGGQVTLHIVGVATLAIARWTDDNNGAEALDADNDNADPGDDCQNIGGHSDPSKFQCGTVWGYLIGTDIRPPEFLLQKIGSSPNPLAPTLIALSE